MSSPRDDPALAAVLARIEGALAASGRKAARALAPGAKNTQIWWLGEQLGARVPRPLRQLLAWHNGERRAATLFQAFVGPKIEDTWGSYSGNPFSVRLLRVAEIARVGVTPAYLDEKGSLLRVWREGPRANRALIPFVWVRDGGDGHADEADEGDETGAPDFSDDDWFFAIDDVEHRVWLFEEGNQGLEGVFAEAPDLAAWLAPLADALERGALELPRDACDSDSRQRVDAASALVALLVERRAIEIASDARDALIDALRPVLRRKPKRRAVEGALAVLEDHPALAEVFADDDVLSAFVEEFTG